MSSFTKIIIAGRLGRAPSFAYAYIEYKAASALRVRCAEEQKQQRSKTARHYPPPIPQFSRH